MARALQVLCLGAIAWGLVDAWRLAWVCDDAFISFRYAQHLVAGEGLVFNAGEQVEGYTNFLWTLLVAGAMALGADPVVAAVGMGLASFAGVTFVLLAASRSMGSVLPLAATGLALHLHARTFATSGLETMFFTLWVTLALVGAVGAQRERDWCFVGLFGALATLTRPDGALFCAVALLPAFTHGRRAVVAGGLPGAVLVLPWVAWKLDYYGHLLPNTYYAKGAGEPWWDQGLRYLGLYFGMYGVLLLALVGLLAMSLRGSGAGWSGARAPRLWGLACVLYLLHVAKVGGDFMFARFVIPVTPLLLLGAEWLVMRLDRGRALVGGAFLAGLVFAPYPSQILDPSADVDEERLVYPWEQIEQAEVIGSALANVTEGLDMRVVVYGSQVMLAYYAGFPVVIENFGLTDATIARMPLEARSKPGHSRQVTAEYLRERGVDLILGWRVLLEDGGFTEAEVAGLPCRIVTYRAELWEELGRRGARYTDFQGLLDDYLVGIDAVSDEDLAADYAVFRDYYFRFNDDAARAAPFEERLGG